LKDLISDVEEADANVKAYKDKIDDNPQMGLDLYGSFLNDSLKIKGQSRERVIKLLNVVKDRVKSKEMLQLSKGVEDKEFDPEMIADLAAEIKKLADG